LLSLIETFRMAAGSMSSAQRNHPNTRRTTLAERVLQYIAVLFISVAVFGALYTGILLLE
jgi:formate-dependent nitrite reductase membrane component NrfD